MSVIKETTEFKDLTFSSSFGRGNPVGQFNTWDVAFDHTGNTYLADSENHCIQVFTQEGKFLRKKGSGEGELNHPSSVSIEPEGLVYITDKNNHHVSIFTCQGKLAQSFGTRGVRPGEFNKPNGIVVDTSGLIYASDRHNNIEWRYFKYQQYKVECLYT